MNKPRFLLGIDPDSEKSGFALLNCNERKLDWVGCLSFAEAVDYLNRLIVNEKIKPLKVVIEDSDTATAYNPMTKMTKRAAFAYGRSVGKCHATYEHLVEYAKKIGLDIEPIKPLVKTWKGYNRKISQAEAAQFMTGLPGRCNQECRDAALLAWNYANMPIHISASFYIQNKKK